MKDELIRFRKTDVALICAAVFLSAMIAGRPTRNPEKGADTGKNEPVSVPAQVDARPLAWEDFLEPISEKESIYVQNFVPNPVLDRYAQHLHERNLERIRARAYVDAAREGNRKDYYQPERIINVNLEPGWYGQRDNSVQWIYTQHYRDPFTN